MRLCSQPPVYSNWKKLVKRVHCFQGQMAHPRIGSSDVFLSAHKERLYFLFYIGTLRRVCTSIKLLVGIVSSLCLVWFAIIFLKSITKKGSPLILGVKQSMVSNVYVVTMERWIGWKKQKQKPACTQDSPAKASCHFLIDFTKYNDISN